MKAEKLRKQDIIDANSNISAIQKLKEKQKELEEKKEQWEKILIQKEIEKEKENQSKIRRIGGLLVNNLVSLSRTMTLGLLDVGYLSVQGGYFMRTKPLVFKNALKDAYKSSDLDEKSFNEWVKGLKSIPMYEEMLKSGLRIPNQSLRQEIFEQEYRTSMITQAIENVPLLNLINKNGRFSVKFLAHLRMEVYSDLYNKLSAVDKQDPKTLEKLADFVNVRTGGGGVIGETKGGSLNEAWGLFTSARNTSSMLQQTYLGMVYQLAKNYDNKKSISNQSMIVNQLKYDVINQATLLATLYFTKVVGEALLGGDDEDDWSIETSPFSTDFLKLKVGNKKYFDSGGTTSLNVSTLRLFTAMLNLFGVGIKNYKNKEGYSKIGGSGFTDKRGLDVLSEASLNRFSPFLAPIKTMLIAKETKEGNYSIFGEEYTPTELKVRILRDIFEPINLNSIFKDYSDEQIDGMKKTIKLSTNAILAAFGLGVGDIKKPKPKDKNN